MPSSPCFPFDTLLKQISFHCNYVRRAGRFAILIIPFTSCIAGRTCIAEPIVFKHSGTGSGTLDGVPFNDTMFVITAHGDTANRQIASSRAFSIDHVSATIDLVGIGNFSFTSPTRTFNNHGDATVGFSRGDSIGGGDLLNGPTNSEFATWQMLSSVGPYSGPGFLLAWSANETRQPIMTTGGVLVFQSGSKTVTFAARVGSLAGDLNGDGAADAADYVVWRKGFATGAYTQADYNTWRANFGMPAAGAAAGARTSLQSAVPEPGILALAALALAALSLMPCALHHRGLNHTR